jgi:superoxide reductase
MKTFLCKVCGHIEFNAAPDKCPVCGVTKENFIEQPDIIKKPGSTTLGEPEKKHIPTIIVVRKCGLIPEGCVDVHVKVGEIEHPMQKEHYIMNIDFYLDKKYIAHVALAPESVHPAAALHLKANSGTLTAVERCNLHGYWMAETSL